MNGFSGCESLDDNEKIPFLESIQPESRARQCWNSILFWVYLFWLGLSVFFNAILLAQRLSSANVDAICSEHTADYPSPISDEIAISYHTEPFDGRLMNESIYTRAPSREVEQAWTDLGANLRLTIVPEDQASRYGIDPGFLKLSPKDGGGYPMLFEFHHHLHCLNMLRQTSFFNFAHYNATQKNGYQDGEEMMRKHIGHCINQLRQVIMCNPDMGMLGQVWVDDMQEPYVKFDGTKHMCKNWDAIREKAKKLQVPEGSKVKVRLRGGDLHIPRVP